MAWNARSLVALAVACCSCLPAKAQVMADDHPDNAAATPMTTGTTYGRFDHRWPRWVDTDTYRLQTLEGHIYRARLIVESPSPDQQQASALNGSPVMENGSGAMIHYLEPLRWNDVTLSPGRQTVIFAVEGVAKPDGSSVPYRLVVEDLGLAHADPVADPAEAPSVAVGEWFSGEIAPNGEAAFDALSDRDIFTVALQPGRRYRVERELLAPTGWLGADFGGYIEPTDPRYPPYSAAWPFMSGEEGFDAVASGTMVVVVTGLVFDVHSVLPYRARVVDAGAAEFDDHADWPQEATPIAVDTPIEFTLGDISPVRASRWPYQDVDCFRVSLTAGRRYHIRQTVGADSLTYRRPGFEVSRAGSSEPLAMNWGWTETFFKPGESGDYIVRVIGDGVVARQILEVRDMGVSVDDHPDVYTTALPSRGPGRITGTLEDGRDVDVFRFDAPPGARVTATLVEEGSSGGPITGTLVVRSAAPYNLSYPLLSITPYTEPRVSGAALVERWENLEAVYLSVLRPDASDDAPPRPYTIDMQISPPQDAVDDWPDSAEGATLVSPGDAPRWAVRDHDGDVDVFVADFVAGHVYRLAGGPVVLPIGTPYAAATPWDYQGRGLFQPTTTGRYQLIYPFGSSEVSVIDDGAVQDDLPPRPSPLKVSPGSAVNGRMDFAGDSDEWIVAPALEGLYEIELVAAPTVRVEFAAADWSTTISTEDYSYPPSTAERSVKSRFPVLSRLGVLPPIVVRAAGEPDRAYSVTVRLVQAFRPHSENVSVGEWVAGGGQADQQPFRFRVPVTGGRLYAVDFGDGFETDYLVTVTDDAGAMIAQGATRWVQPASGFVRVSLPSGMGWYRMRVVDLGPAVDDHQASWEGATLLALGEEASGVLNYPGDVDSFRMPLERSVSYTAMLTLGEEAVAYVGSSTSDPRRDAVTTYWSSVWWSNRGGSFELHSYEGGQPGLFALRLDPLAPAELAPVHYTLRIWASCPADMGRAAGERGPDGVLDNNDFIAYIDAFFAMNPMADIGKTGGLEGADDRLDNNDFIVFINRFFAGCP